MLPRWHIILGAAFTLFIWYIAPTTHPLYLLLLFLASFLIDFDHYVCAARKNGSYSLFKAFEYHKESERKHRIEHAKGIRKKGDFHLFHTVEFHALIMIIGLFWTPFLYIFIGMVFHSLLDLISILRNGVFYRREYFLFNWIRESH